MKHFSISDSLDLLHKYLQQPTLTPEDHIVHAVHLNTLAIQDVKINNKASKLAAIQDLKRIFNTWRVTPQQKDIPPWQSNMLKLQRKTQGTPHNSQQSNTRPPQQQQSPTVTSKGAQPGTITKGDPQGTITKGAFHKQRHVQETIAHRTRDKKSKSSQSDTNPIVSRTCLQTTTLASHMLAQQATA